VKVISSSSAFGYCNLMHRSAENNTRLGNTENYMQLLVGTSIIRSPKPYHPFGKNVWLSVGGSLLAIRLGAAAWSTLADSQRCSTVQQDTSETCRPKKRPVPCPYCRDLRRRKLTLELPTSTSKRATSGDVQEPPGFSITQLSRQVPYGK
jgi:hypothetical protein